MATHQPQLPDMPPRAVFIRVRPRVVGSLFKVTWWPEPDRYDVDFDQLELIGSATADADGLADVLGSVGRDVLRTLGRGPARLS
jgi:hypothetical protein